MSMTLNFFEHSFDRGRRLQEAGRIKEAAGLFDRLGLHAEIPNELAAEALVSLGQLQLDQGKIQAARRTASEACRRDPFAAEAHFLHAQACIEGEDADLDQAYGSLLAAIEQDPEVAIFRAELGKIQIALGMAEEGIASLELAVELEPNNPAMLRDLVDALMDLGREAEAFTRARNALFRFPRIQGFRALWSDLCFCQAADELASTEEQVGQTAPLSKPRILRFELIETQKTSGRIGQRHIRHDEPSPLGSPHFPLPASKTDRRRA